MAKDLYGNFYSAWITTGSEAVGDDLFDTAKTTLNLTKILAHKVELVSSGSLSVQLNTSGSYFELSDHSGSYLLNIAANDMLVNSVKVKESDRLCHITIIYQ
jgi:hypothetical protein